MAVVALSFCPAWGQAQYNADMYLNIDWQYNVPLGISFADKSSGWGMNFETGYYFPCNIGLGVFFAYHTNNEYVPRRTIEASPTSAVTTDQQHSLYQVPFGVTGRYRFLPRSICEPYVAMKLGAIMPGSLPISTSFKRMKRRGVSICHPSWAYRFVLSRRLEWDSMPHFITAMRPTKGRSCRAK